MVAFIVVYRTNMLVRTKNVNLLRVCDFALNFGPCIMNYSPTCFVGFSTRY